jgi:hypothetical protein
MSTCLIIPVANDELEDDVALTVNSFKRFVPNATVFFGVDEDYANSWLSKYGSVIRVKGFGIGKALDSAVKEALKDNCEFIIKSDAHMYFVDFEYPLWLEVPYTCTMDGNCFGASTAKWPSMDWLFTYGQYHILPMTTEPVYAYPGVIAEIMNREFGCVYCSPYWGPEAYDFTLTACRRYGWCVRQARWRVRHKYKKEWPKDRVQRNYPWEPWMAVYNAQPYFTSMSIAWQIFITRHVNNPRKHPRYNEYFYNIALKYYPDRMKYVNGYPVEFIYDKLGVPIEQRIGA